MGGTRSEIYESKQLSSKLYEGKHDYSIAIGACRVAIL